MSVDNFGFEILFYFFRVSTLISESDNYMHYVLI